ncbi:N-acetyltransferase [Streptomyces pluripotens]|uniref:N-acetyltransferase n=1 Tax=Streptomyces pluripotens TaxID=1355015 RepID=A0A221P4B7_9ACTN|nr:MULTISPECIES: GNAT family N-acetyltransferase [Streptomyces]ARP72851.1 N-acetyltransferase [Streptomyces pluripotens]ASN27101.1 N-acetyltransferase [Streptomyces pluripotens]KIE23591.1 GNAT family acetyltraansferase [Streptomyces sp. MUSC 125]MCH0559844.1 GNAT family N-acetyltransferase [Streptomyces sp. MUM 16J]
MKHLIRTRGIADADWPQVAALEAEAYTDPSLTEGEELLRSRARASAGTCFALDVDGQLAGYVLALPYPRFRCPDLTRPEGVVHHSVNLHLHDLVVTAPLRRRGLGTRLVRRLTDEARARGFETMSLIAVAGRETFWRANGYRPHPGTRLPPGYGGDAVYMVAQMAASRPHEGRDAV